MSRVAKKAMGNIFSGLVSLLFVVFWKLLIVDYLHKGWDGYGHVIFYASLISMGFVTVANLIVAAWALLTD